MPKEDNVVEDSEFVFKRITDAFEPHLPSVPEPPLGVQTASTEPNIRSPARKKGGKKTKDETQVDDVFIRSEIYKIDFFLKNHRLLDAKQSLRELVRAVPKPLKKKYQYDFKRLKASVELLEI